MKGERPAAGPNAMDWSILKGLLKPGTSCVITTHYSPDGDAIGSELALAEFLRQAGIEPHIVNQDPVPRIYEFLDVDNMAKTYAESDIDAVKDADLVFLLDVSGWDRIGSPAEAISSARAKRICIDHHATSDGIAEIEFADSAASATGELIYDMILALGGEITPAMARALFVAIATDTGWFRFSNTSPRVFEITADLTARGAAPDELHNLVYEQLRWERMALLARGLADLQSAAGGRIAWMAFTRQMFQETGADDEDVEGIVDLLRTIGGVEIVILFREAEDGTIHVSLRSKDGSDVSRLAELFGGGGHVRAAGIRMAATLSEATEKIVAAAERLLAAPAQARPEAKNSPTAIVSDIHSNIHALRAVLDDIRAQGVERIVCLGDVVGYGAHPEECVDIARTFSFCLRGNHEAGVLGRLDLFNTDARRAGEWTRSLMKPGLLAGSAKKERWRFIEGLAESREEGEVLFVHGSPRDPVWEYLFESDCAALLAEPSEKIAQSLDMVNRFCFVGHTHVPGVITREGDFLTVESLRGRFELEPGSKAIVNVGSVGQPRDGDARACYAIFDGATVTFRRIQYDVAAAAHDIIKTPELPDANGERLLRGI